MSWPETRRPSRIFRARMKWNAPGTVSHITQRASGTEVVFHEEDDYLEMLGRLKDISTTCELEVLSFVLMTNHVHLMLRQSKRNLPEAMRELFSRYARRHNTKYERKGHLFGGPYRQAICRDEGYALAVSLYIHLNPVRAGLAPQPADYRWSSSKLFLSSHAPDSFVKADRVLGWLSDDREEAVRAYGRLLAQGLEVPARDVHEEPRAIHRFRSALVKRDPSINGPLLLKGRDRGKASPKGVALEEIEEEMAGFMEGRPRWLPRERAAKKYLVAQLLSRGYTREEIAIGLGISRKSLYNLLKDDPATTGPQ